MKIDNKEFLNPQQQLYQNTKDIEELKADYMPVYSYEGLIGSTTIHAVNRNSTNVPAGVNIGWLLDYTGKLFKITDGSATTLLIDYYAQIKGPKGDTGNTGPQGETGPQGPQGPQGEPGETTIDIEVVQALPVTGEEGVIYFVPKQDGDTDDLYEEYTYVNDNWELLGGATVDLTKYALKSEIPVVNEGFTPKTSYTYDLGSSTKLYKDIYVSGLKSKYFNILTGGVNDHGTAIFSSTNAQGTTEATLRLDYNKIQANQNLVPSANNTLDLGTTGLKYKDLYLAGSLKDGTNSVAIADIVTTNDLPTYSISNVVTDSSDVLGLQVTDGSVTYNIHNTTANPTLAGTESNLTSIDIGGTAYAIPSFSGSYTDLTNKPTLGTAAAADTGTSSGDVPVLDANGKLSTSVLPAIAVTDTFVVSSEAAMLALTAQVGDIAVRTDLNKSFILQTDGASTLSHWQELLTPTDSVTSVNGQTGAVTLTIPSVPITEIQLNGITKNPNNGVVNLSGIITSTGEQTIFGPKTFYEIKILGVQQDEPIQVDFTHSSDTSEGLLFKVNNDYYGYFLPTAYSFTGNKTIATTDQLPNLSNYIQKSSTAGLVKNDGTIDTNTYLTSAPITSVNGHTGSVTVTQSDLNIVYSATQPSNPVNGTIWIKPTN